jgi:polysaccharide deacetylase family protein (PEP-CTERM system associated)
MSPSPVVNAMTVDVEDYFQVSAFESVVSRERWDHYERRVVGNTERLLAIFDEFGVKATFFVLGWVAEREPGLVRKIAAAGHEVASHGYAHRLVYRQRPEEFREDIRRSKAVLESLIGVAVLGYRAPSYSITLRSLWALDVVAEEGFLYDASVFPIHHDRYGIPTAPRRMYRVGEWQREAGSAPETAEHRLLTPSDRLIEIPGSTIRVGGVNLPIAGGGYFRLLPYAWSKWGIARLNRREATPAVFYVHPWEVDPLQPRLPASGLSRFRHYRNLAATQARLVRLLSDFEFGAVATTFLDVNQRSGLALS